MAQLIKINNQILPLKEYKGQRVVTFKEIDKVHGRTDGTAHRNFKTNRNHFIEGVDYFRLQKDEIRPFGITSPNGGIIITESGYLMLAKSFTDDLAWTVQRELVNCYFHNKPAPKQEEPEQLTLETAEYHYFDKTYKGEPIITLADFEHFTGITAHKARYFLDIKGKKNVDYILIEEKALAQFKTENPNVSRLASAIFAITKSGFVKLMKRFKCKAEPPKCFIESKTPKLPENATAGAVEIKLPERPEIQPREKFSVAEFTVAIEVVNALKINAEERLRKSDCFHPDVVENNVRMFQRTIEAIAVNIAIG
ncbi:MAG: ORF6N domain-containing protein [Oscillospiraceae bacterium]